MQTKTKTRRLTESAMLLCIAIVLELLAKLFIPELPFGGQITPVSMLPVLLIGYRHGTKWGFVAAFTYALLEMALGAKTVSAAFLPGYFGEGRLLVNAFLMCVLDYIAAFTVLGLGGIFRNRIQNRGVALACGSLVALSARYLCHILSGYILFAGYAEWFFTQDGFPAWGAALVADLSPTLLGIVYSVVYNGMYMIPEILLTFLAALALGKIRQITATIS